MRKRHCGKSWKKKNSYDPESRIPKILNVNKAAFDSRDLSQDRITNYPIWCLVTSSDQINPNKMMDKKSGAVDGINSN